MSLETINKKNEQNPNKIKHFGIWFDKDNPNLQINREHYALFGEKELSQWSLETCQRHQNDCLINFDKNMKSFSKIDKDGLDWLLRDVMSWGDFKEITDLNDCDGMAGVYIMVLGEYGQIYIGQSNNIKKRIQKHWTTIKEFDKLIFGSVDNSVLSIDSFGPLDTTRVIVLEIDNKDKRLNIEMLLTENIHQVYQLNRIGGGGISDKISVLATLNRLEIKGLQEDARYAHVTYFEKKDKLPLNYLENGTTVCFAIKDYETDKIIEHYGCFIGVLNSPILMLIEYCSDGSAACDTEYLFDCHSSREKTEAAIRYYKRDQIVEAWTVNENKKKICIYVPKQNQ